MLQCVITMLPSNDVVTSMAYNYHGTILATCSADHEIRLFQVVRGETEDFTPIFSWKAHDSAITNIAWCHPEFGQLIASTGLDCTIRIWDVSSLRTDSNSYSSPVEKARIPVSGRGATCLEFFPNYLGLKLLASTTDARVLVLDCVDSVHWAVEHDFPIGLVTNETGAFVSVCRNRTAPVQFAVAYAGVLRVHRLQPNNKYMPINSKLDINQQITAVAWCPNMGRLYEIIAVGTSDGNIILCRFKDDQLTEITTLSHQSPVTRLDWNILGSVLTSSSAESVKLWKSGFLGNWQELKEITS